mmetsp:Transcript_4595/g.6701  ORF Transcript_4595/g.6701 Transcript_4595/m.6701 type:complete len:117 (+) Transcript_4595:280-630(+)
MGWPTASSMGIISGSSCRSSSPSRLHCLRQTSLVMVAFPEATIDCAFLFFFDILFNIFVIIGTMNTFGRCYYCTLVWQTASDTFARGIIYAGSASVLRALQAGRIYRTANDSHTIA